jgi:VWFA-related protein
LPTQSRAGALRRWILLATLVFLALSLPLPGQQTPTFSSDVKVVNLLATVRDKHGQIVSNLTKDDFKLEEDGRPQTIRYFAKETDLPLTLGLLVDTSVSQRRVLEQERIASYAFLEHLMREDKDKAFVVHFDWDIELLQDLTSSRKKLNAALEKLDNPEFEQSGGGGGGSPGSGGHHRGGGTTLYDAAFLASDELMQKQHGRKALIILSDGVDTGSKLTLTRAIEAAQRANTLVYSILFSDAQAYGSGGYGIHMGGMGGGMGRPGGGGMGRGGPQGYPQQSHPDGKKVLEQISRETGGRFFEVSKKQSIDQIYASIEEELRNQYSLGYTPDKSDAAPGYHKIHLTTTQKDLVVQTRDGYYSGDNATQP